MAPGWIVLVWDTSRSQQNEERYPHVNKFATIAVYCWSWVELICKLTSLEELVNCTELEFAGISSRMRVIRVIWDFMQIKIPTATCFPFTLLTLRISSSDRKGHVYRLVRWFCGRRLLVTFTILTCQWTLASARMFLSNFLNGHKQIPSNIDRSIVSFY